MKDLDKILQLKTLIESTLTPLIDKDYWLLEVPYYTNIGDTLIWQGEMDFLNKLPYKCKGMSSFFTEVPNDIKEGEIILLQGGGNFGDLYEQPQDYRIKVARKYPNNKIIIFPQTVWFEDKNKMKECAEIFSSCKNLTICARDKVSYSILKENFSNAILLVPDMAFCINIKKWKRYSATDKDLLLKRDDKELKTTTDIENLESSIDMTVTDWPTFNENSWQTTWLRRTRKYLPCFYDWYAYAIFRPYLINTGIKLIESHKMIYSTRLHAAILSVLLGKASDLVWLDNSYGKNRNFYETWLKDCDGIQFIDGK